MLAYGLQSGWHSLAREKAPMIRHRTLATVALLFPLAAAAASGCVASEPEEVGDDTADRCAEIIAHMAQCYPDLATEALCTADTVAQYDALGLDTQSCEGIEGLGKADLFAFGGCGQNERVCGWIFCCDDYDITWLPETDEDWNVLPVVEDFQAATPGWASAAIEQASLSELRAGVSVSYQQQVAETVGGAPREMAVEITRQVIEIPYPLFVQRLATEDWGIQLDHYLGGEVLIYEQDEQGRATRQLERMVLSPFPCDWESPLTNNDMTKVEVIRYGADWSTVTWRVMHSNNNSTETDVGSVDFRAYGESSTVVTFHSAHRLNAPGGIHIPNSLLAPSLSSTFLDFVRHYRNIVE